MSRSVLIVDDLSVNRKILKATLRNDYDILEAANGEEALAVMRAHYKSLSAILLDIMMPVMDGYEVLRRMRSDASLAPIPVIMITGNEDEEARVKCLDLGANDFVMKPYNPDIIRHCLRNNIVLRETEAAVHALQRDRLTGLYNRDAFFEKVQEAVQQHEAGYYIMAFFDIDKFKVINDQFGTSRGDEVLKYIADVFRNGFETHGGICCRVAADDFAVLYPASFIDSPELAALRRKSSAVEGLVSPITFSIGRYLVDDLSLSPSAMFDRAMLAAESVKGRYDEQIAQYDESMRKRLLSEQEVVTEMGAALAGNQFEAWYQPQYNHATGARVGAEALARWRHPQKGLISPGLFIPIFEKNGFVYELDKFIWEDACRHLRKWTDEGRDPLPVSVNISRYDIFRPDLVDVIAGLVKKYDLPVDLLRLEVTESAFSQSATQIIAVVQRLIDAGFTVEIDDFGSGYSSLNTLKDVPAQVLKLDMKFLESSTNSQRGGTIVESIVRMAAWLGMSVIAEGVETVQQADFLRSIGCDYIQGYLYARPMPAAEYEAHCEKSGREEKLLALETVENLDNNAFWDPRSMDTLIFNSYVGGACIFEYHNGEMYILRMNSKYIETFGEGVSDEIAFRQSPLDYMDERNRSILLANIQSAIDTGAECTCEICTVGLYGIEKPVYIRSAVRVIARASERYLLYCSVINITARREMMEQLRMSEEENRLAIQHSKTVVCRYNVATKQLKIAPHANAIFELVSLLEDVPDAPIRMGKISPETADGYRAFYDSMQGENLHQMTTLITVSAMSQKALSAKTDEVKKMLRAVNFEARECKWDIEDAI
ncbi:MAG: EAL domain-containing protein, partial [Eubacteriales bacterium]|nr:EAL domain-containing protein [Eubacteriales bacterium]